MTPDVRAQAVMDRIAAYQADGRRHPLTCGTDSSHRVLEPVWEGRIVLRCPDCDYRQTFIPSFLAETHSDD